MKLWRLLFLSIFCLPAFAESLPVCSPPLSLEEFERILFQTREENFPELMDTKIVVTTFRSDAYFLQAQPIVSSLPKNRQKRRYTVQLNLKLLDCPPSSDGLKAILIHELEHIKDYTTWSSARIARHALSYSTSLKFKVSYERQTDLKTLEKGVHHGLADYRNWVYQWLSPRELKRKLKIYMTPEEIWRTRE